MVHRTILLKRAYQRYEKIVARYVSLRIFSRQIWPEFNQRKFNHTQRTTSTRVTISFHLLRVTIRRYVSFSWIRAREHDGVLSQFQKEYLKRIRRVYSRGLRAIGIVFRNRPRCEFAPDADARENMHMRYEKQKDDLLVQLNRNRGLARL